MELDADFVLLCTLLSVPTTPPRKKVMAISEFVVEWVKKDPAKHTPEDVAKMFETTELPVEISGEKIEANSGLDAVFIDGRPAKYLLYVSFADPKAQRDPVEYNEKMRRLREETGFMVVKDQKAYEEYCKRMGASFDTKEKIENDW